MREHEYEPIKGLPEELPEGEYMVWQGSPRWQALARRAFHVDTIAIYFALVMAIHAVYLLMNGQAAGDILIAMTWKVPLSLTGVGLMALAGWLYARGAVYTLTSRRIVIRSGVVTPMMVNLPLDGMESAGVRYCSDGTGDVLLSLKPGTRKLFYTLLWPNVRPWHFRPVQPLMRAIEQPEALVEALGRVMSELKLEDNTPRVTPSHVFDDSEGSTHGNPIPNS